MKRKWSYVAAMMLTASCGCLFTGCIDNDEPYGIEQIRVATANLLEAKKAAVEAEAAAANAAVEVEKIKAEVEKAKLEVAKITAEAEAQAKILQAQAEAAKTQAEADLLKAKAESILALAQAKANEIQAEVDDQIAKTQDWIKNAELNYQKLLYAWEQTKIKDSAAFDDALFSAIDAAYTSYINQLNFYNAQNKKYLDAQRRLAKFELDLIWDPNGGDDKKGGFISPEYNQKAILENAVASAQQQIDDANAAIDKVNEFNAKLDGVNSSDLAQMLSDYQEELSANTEALAEAEVELKALEINNPEIYDAPNKIEQKIQEAQNAPIAVAPYTYTPDASLAPLGMTEDIEVVPADATFNLTNDGLDTYNRYANKYRSLINGMQNWLMDDNDKAWTTARINEMTRQLAEANKVYSTDKEAWELAKTVYNMGNTPDVSTLPNEAAVEAAVEAYNALQPELQALADELGTANEDRAAKLKAYSDAWNVFYGDGTNGDEATQKWNAAQNAFNEANSEAHNAYWNAVRAAEEVRDQANKNANEAEINAYREYQRSMAAYMAAQNEADLDPTNTTLQAAVTAAETAMKDAEKAWKEAQANIEKVANDAEAACEKAIAAANTALVAATNAAEKAYDEAHAAWIANGEGNWDKDSAYAPVKEAYEAYEAADAAAQTALDNFLAARTSDKLTDLYADMVDAINAQEEAIGYSWEIKTIPNAYEIYQFGNGEIAEFPVATVPVLYQDPKTAIYSNAKQYLIRKSQLTYGLLGLNYDNDGKDWDVDRAFLVDNVTVEMVNDYIKAMNPGWEDFMCVQLYDQFGSYGDTIYLENRIAVANAYLANADLTKTVLGTLEQNLEALEASKESAEDAIEKLELEKEDAELAITKLKSSVTSKIESLQSMGRTLADIISTIKSGLRLMESVELGATAQNPVQNMKDAMASTLGWANNQLEAGTAALDLAKYQLAQYESGYKDLANPYQSTVDLLKANVESAKEYLDFLKARVDQLQEAYEKATKE